MNPVQLSRSRWLAVATVLVLVVAAILAWQVLRLRGELSQAQAMSRSDANEDRRVAQAVAAAESIAEKASSYDYRTLDRDFAWIASDTTSDFGESNGKSLRTIRKAIEVLKARADGKVVAAAGEPLEDGTVSVLLFVDQTVTRHGQDKETFDPTRMTMTMVEENGVWLVDEFDLV